MKIKVRSHESVTELNKEADEFLESLGLDVSRWKEEQECELAEHGEFKIFGMNFSRRLAIPSGVLIWRFEIKTGANQFLVNDELIAVKILKISNHLVEDAVASLPFGLQYLSFANSGIRALPGSVKNFSTLLTLNCSLCKSLSDISVLSDLTSLSALNLAGCESLGDVSVLSRLTNLLTLNLGLCKSIADVSVLARLSNLTSLELGGHESLIRDVSVLNSLSNLTDLNLRSCRFLSDLSGLSGLTNLTSVELRLCRNLSDLSALSDLPNLTRLNLSGCELIKDISPLSGLKSLGALDLGGCRHLKDLSVLSGLINLKFLNLDRCESLRDGLVLSGLTALKSLSLRGCKTLSNLSALSGLQNLTSLDLSECDEIRDLAPLSGLQSLRFLSFTSRRLQSIECLRELAALRSLKEFNPPEVAEVLAYAAVLRSDRAHILSHAKGWLGEAAGWQDGSLALLERFAATLGEAFSLLGEHEIEIPYEEYLQSHPEYSSAPWKAWLAGTRSESGLALMRRRIERQVIPASTPGCIGGICAVLAAESEALEEVEWSKAWLTQMEEQWKERSKDLLPVSAEICLAYARLGESEALARWLKRFTDPSDLGLLDPVQVALATFQMTRGDFVAAQAHIFAVQSAQMRDPLLRRLVEAIGVNDPLQSSLLLLLIEDAGARAQLAIRMVLKKEFASNETVLHRLIVSLDANPSALAELISNLPTETSNPVIQKISEGLKIDRKALYQKLAAELESLVVKYRANSVE